MKFYLSILLVLLTSCSKIVLGVMGFRFGSKINSNEFTEIPKKYFDKIDGVGYWTAVLVDSMSKDTSIREGKNFFQPLHYLLFDSSGKWIGSVANCDSEVGGMRSDWSPFLDTFPIQRWPTNKTIDFAKMCTYLDGDTLELGKTKYTAVIFWSKKFGRHNKIFLSQVSKHLKTNISQFSKVYFVNFDYLLDEVELEVDL